MCIDGSFTYSRKQSTNSLSTLPHSLLYCDVCSFGLIKQDPLGFFDPLGLLDDADQERFDRLRFVELKHGRICQLAFLGQITTRAGFRLPGAISTDGTQFSDVGEGWAGSFDVPVAGALQILAFCGFLELAGWKQNEGSFPGDFSASGFPVGFIGDYDEEEQLRKRAVELNNGRAAMMGILGLMVHEQLGTPLPIIGQP